MLLVNTGVIGLVTLSGGPFDPTAEALLEQQTSQRSMLWC